MQLCLENSELDLIANILLQRESEISTPTLPGQADLGATPPKVDKEMYEEILQRVLARDTAFDSDELDQLALILEEEDAALKAQIAREPVATRLVLDKKRRDLSRVLEKIEEVCVML